MTTTALYEIPVLARQQQPVSRFLSRLYRLAAVILGGVAASQMMPALADQYPVRPIRIVVPYAPGGGVDFVGRLLAKELNSQLKQSVVVDNRGGGGSGVGASIVARSTPDGYTLLVGDPALVTNVRLIPDFPVKLEKDLVPVAMLTASPLLLSVHPGLPVKSVSDLIAYSKSKPNGLSFSSAGVGSTPHLAGEMLHFLTKGNMVHVAYKGSGPAMLDLISGQIDFAFATQAAAGSYARSGRIRPLATTGETPSAEFPELPTVGKTIPGFKVIFWTGLFAPAGTPAAIIKRLDDTLRNSWQSEELANALKSSGDRPAYQSAASVRAFLSEESRSWHKLIADASIKGQ
jgi:tripartite-type tricarboxylate transporter receptor subunit TctC